MHIVKHDNPTHEFDIKKIQGDPYAILRVSKDATDGEISRAYKNLAAVYHHDVFKGDKEIFILIGRAKECLMDSKKRALYDDFYIFGAYDGKPVKRAAFAQIQKMMIQTVIQAPQLDSTDIKLSMIQGIDRGYHQLNGELDKAKRLIKKYEKTMTRISGTGKQGNRLIHLLKMDMGVSIKTEQNRIAQLKSELLIFDEVLLLLEEFECTFDEPEPVSGFGSATISW